MVIHKLKQYLKMFVFSSSILEQRPYKRCGRNEMSLLNAVSIKCVIHSKPHSK